MSEANGSDSAPKCFIVVDGSFCFSPDFITYRSDVNLPASLGCLSKACKCKIVSLEIRKAAIAPTHCDLGRAPQPPFTHIYKLHGHPDPRPTRDSHNGTAPTGVRLQISVRSTRRRKETHLIEDRAEIRFEKTMRSLDLPARVPVAPFVVRD